MIILQSSGLFDVSGESVDMDDIICCPGLEAFAIYFCSLLFAKVKPMSLYIASDEMPHTHHYFLYGGDNIKSS